MEYEINFLILQSKTEKLDEIRQATKKIIEGRGGKLTDEHFYQKRKLAFKIEHEQYGFYSVFRFTIENQEGEKEPIAQLRKDLDLFADVTRYIIVRTDELPALQKEIKEPSALERESIKKEEVDQVVSDKKKEAVKKIEKPAPKKDEIKKEDVEKEIKKTDKKEPKGKKKDDASLEDLDKKLDEILNI